MARANLRGEGMFASGSRTGVFAGVVALDLRGRPYTKGVRENDSFGEDRGGRGGSPVVRSRPAATLLPQTFPEVTQHGGQVTQRKG